MLVLHMRKLYKFMIYYKSNANQLVLSGSLSFFNFKSLILVNILIKQEKDLISSKNHIFQENNIIINMASDIQISYKSSLQNLNHFVLQSLVCQRSKRSLLKLRQIQMSTYKVQHSISIQKIHCERKKLLESKITPNIIFKRLLYAYQIFYERLKCAFYLCGKKQSNFVNRIPFLDINCKKRLIASIQKLRQIISQFKFEIININLEKQEMSLQQLEERKVNFYVEVPVEIIISNQRQRNIQIHHQIYAFSIPSKQNIQDGNINPANPSKNDVQQQRCNSINLELELESNIFSKQIQERHVQSNFNQTQQMVFEKLFVEKKQTDQTQHEKLLKQQNGYLRQRLIQMSQTIEEFKQSLNRQKNKSKLLKKQYNCIENKSQIYKKNEGKYLSLMADAQQKLGQLELELNAEKGIRNSLQKSIQQLKGQLKEKQAQFYLILQQINLELKQKEERILLIQESERKVLDEIQIVNQQLNSKKIELVELQNYYNEEINGIIATFKHQQEELKKQMARIEDQNNYFKQLVEGKSKNSSEEQIHLINEKIKNRKSSISFSISEAQNLKNIIEQKQSKYQSQLNQLIQKQMLSEQNYRMKIKSLEFQIANLNNHINNLNKEMMVSKQEESKNIFIQKQNKIEFNLEMNLLINNLARRISFLEEHIEKQRVQKYKLSMKIKQLQSQININSEQSSSQSLEDLLQKCLIQLENQKNISYQLKQEVQNYKKIVERFKKENTPLHHFSQDTPKNLSFKLFDSPQKQQNKNEQNLNNFSTKQIITNQTDNATDKNILGIELEQNEKLKIKLSYFSKQYTNLFAKNEQLNLYILELQNKIQNISKKHNILFGQQYDNIHEDIILNLKQQNMEYQKIIQELKNKNIKNTFNNQENEIETKDDKIQDQLVQKSELLLKKSRKSRKSTKFFTLKDLMNTSPSDYIKLIISIKLIDLGIELIELKQSKKQNLQGLRPQKIYIKDFNINSPTKMRLFLKKNRNQSTDETLLYLAPEVLLGSHESEKSYSWSIGLIIDEIYHQRLYYHKLEEILNHKNNYRFNESHFGEIGITIEKMIKKSVQNRIKLQDAKRIFQTSILAQNDKQYEFSVF